MYFNLKETVKTYWMLFVLFLVVSSTALIVNETSKDTIGGLLNTVAGMVLGVILVLSVKNLIKLKRSSNIRINKIHQMIRYQLISKAEILAKRIKNNNPGYDQADDLLTNIIISLEIGIKPDTVVALLKKVNSNFMFHFDEKPKKVYYSTGHTGYQESYSLSYRRSSGDLEYRNITIDWK